MSIQLRSTAAGLLCSRIPMRTTFNRFLATTYTAVAALSSSVFVAQLFKDSTGTDINTLANWSTVNGDDTPDPASFGTADQLRFNESTAATGTFTMDLSAALSDGNLTVDAGTDGVGARIAAANFGAGFLATVYGGSDTSLRDFNSANPPATTNLDARFEVGFTAVPEPRAALLRHRVE